MSTAPDSSPSGVRSVRPPGVGPDPSRHEAVAYSSPGELAARLAPQVSASVAAGELVTAVLDDEAGQRLRAELGRAAGGVQFLPPATVHTVPGFTTAVRWARNSRQVTGPDARALIIGQQLLELPGCGNEYWARLCIGIEVTGAGLPLTVLCPFHDDPAGWARVRTTHRVLSTGNGSGPNPHYRPPHEVVREHPPAERPELGPPAEELAFRATDLGEVRHLAADVAARAGLDSDRVADVVLAVNELVSNSVEHGPGSGRLRLWLDGPRGLVAEVADRGRLNDPFPGMVRPHSAGPRGRGLWLASELCDVMEVWNDDGTAVRVSWPS